ncbi:MAG: ABC transporter permease [Candidatus Cloacimonetes bacterium]|nr:ABC transporter permease [Candidatus Cloacimonadota bacterium]
MNNHLFKLIWNRRKRNFVTSLGIFISFLVLFLVLVLIVKTMGNYVKPIGYETDDLWFITFDWIDHTEDEIKETLLLVNQALDMEPDIEEYAYSRAYIYSPMVMSATNLSYEDAALNCHIAWGDASLAEVLSIPLAQGVWFDQQTTPDLLEEPIVVTQMLVDDFFSDGIGVGKVLERGEDRFKIIGVIDEFRNGSKFSNSRRVIIRQMIHNASTFTDLGESMGLRILLKVDGSLDADNEMKLIKKLKAIASDWSFDVRELNSIKQSAALWTLVFPGILTIICIFMLVNVGLGLFGVIWYRTDRRKSEIGLRRALGAPAHKIYRQIIGEALVLTTFSLLWGSLFALQFPLLQVIPDIETSTYMKAYLLAGLIIYIITFFCALYPSRKATRIEPAMALHYE